VSDRLLRVYHRLPGRARSVAASLRGFYLCAWRYGSETDRLVEEAHERERWSAESWQRWQEQRLSYVLERAATRVPYYRNQWSQRRRKGDRASWELLENWPVLEKESLRTNPRAFLADDCEVRRLFHEHTSGTSGTPLDLWWSRKTVRAWYALFEARWRRWYGVTRHDRWAILGGQLVTPVEKKDAPFWVWNAALNQLYMSSYHLAPELVSHFLSALERYQIRYLLGYTSSLHALTQVAAAHEPDKLRLAVAIANAEPVLNYQREAIARAFRCPVRETYGMAEIVAAAGECQAGRLHLWPEVGWIEVMEGADYVPRGTPGEFICTGLLNDDMPLIRYRVGDRGALLGDEHVCGCGRTLPALAHIEGRVDDVLYTRDGRPVGRLDPVFKARLAIREAQLIQETLDVVRVRYVPADGFGKADARSIIAGLRARIGSVDVIMEEVDAIPRTSGGKFRAVISKVDRSELQRVLS
jgi:phenylacetate-coenzyme A ligase PaaK-like adenylate-forming protein